MRALGALAQDARAHLSHRGPPADAGARRPATDCSRSPPTGCACSRSTDGATNRSANAHGGINRPLTGDSLQTGRLNTPESGRGRSCSPACARQPGERAILRATWQHCRRSAKRTRRCDRSHRTTVPGRCGIRRRKPWRDWTPSPTAKSARAPAAWRARCACWPCRCAWHKPGTPLQPRRMWAVVRRAWRSILRRAPARCGRARSGACHRPYGPPKPRGPWPPAFDWRVRPPQQTRCRRRRPAGWRACACLPPTATHQRHATPCTRTLCTVRCARWASGWRAFCWVCCHRPSMALRASRPMPKPPRPRLRYKLGRLRPKLRLPNLGLLRCRRGTVPDRPGKAGRQTRGSAHLPAANAGPRPRL
jgi:hypothetical protein